MKKIFSIVAITLFAFTLTGCGNKITEVTCTKDREVVEGNPIFVTSIEDKITFTFKGNKIIKYISESIWRYASESHANDAFQRWTSGATNKTNGVTFEYQVNGNEMISKVTVIRKDITDKEIIKESTYLSYKRDEIIKEHETLGYTCK